MNTHDIELPPLPTPPSLIQRKDWYGAIQAYARSYGMECARAALRPEVTEFELIQDGIPVAGASGKREDAWREIQHYAAQYSEDGPVEIYEVIRRRVEGDGE